MTRLLVFHAGKHELQAVSLDGTRVHTLVAGLDELPDGILVDQRPGHVYWTDTGAPDPGSGGSEDHWTHRRRDCRAGSKSRALG